MLARNIRIEEDLIDQLFNSSEKRLARALLLLALRQAGHSRPRGAQGVAGDMAEMIGTTLPRELLHEQVQGARFHRIRREAPPQGQQLMLGKSHD
jgi:hypothetical protein